MSSHLCPECGAAMMAGSVALSGGLWFCRSTEWLTKWVVWHQVGALAEPLPSNRKTPLHTIVAGKGFRLGNWPKEGLLCPKCGTVAILGKSLGVNY